jgi:hypothetical protein
VAYVQRLNAVGAVPQARCGAREVGTSTRVPFSADFLFYSKR